VEAQSVPVPVEVLNCQARKGQSRIGDDGGRRNKKKMKFSTAARGADHRSFGARKEGIVMVNVVCV
jgi:hypothetical protein